MKHMKMGQKMIEIVSPWTSSDGFIRFKFQTLTSDHQSCLSQRNGTSWADGDLSTHTGESDFSLLGQIDTWNYRQTTDAFTGECGKVRGSADGLFAPGVFNTEKELSIFSTDLCRYVVSWTAIHIFTFL